MNALELYEAAFDSACDYRENTVKYITQYAEGAFGIDLAPGVAEEILRVRLAAEGTTSSNDYYHVVELPLKEIDIEDEFGPEQAFIRSATSRETSPELMKANIYTVIVALEQGDEYIMQNFCVAATSSVEAGQLWADYAGHADLPMAWVTTDEFLKAAGARPVVSGDSNPCKPFSAQELRAWIRATTRPYKDAGDLHPPVFRMITESVAA